MLCPCLESPVQWADAVEQAGLAVSLFIQEGEGPVYLHLLDRQGLPFDREQERRLEHALALGEVHRVRAGRIKETEALSLTVESWAAETARRASLNRPALRKITAAVEKDTPENRALRAALSALGCQLEVHWRPGIPAFSA